MNQHLLRNSYQAIQLAKLQPFTKRPTPHTISRTPPLITPPCNTVPLTTTTTTTTMPTTPALRLPMY
ncbi:hypothetical protein E2C01_038565 [Portunus trituberculatus]|uniref:Uncharacterized protein n=1 Tax=Portunus trituberculatus TaxID=210409 RepID=A0A5B7FKG3_PORTR|nr:hypothetical protein [Portunus trituberculatus]